MAYRKYFVLIIMGGGICAPALGEPFFLDWSGGTFHGCGIDMDKQVACFGEEKWPGLLDAPDGTFSKIVVSRGYSCALHTNGKVKCWGKEKWGNTSPPDHDFIDIAVGSAYGCGLLKDRSIKCWGGYVEPGKQYEPPKEKFRSISLSKNGVRACGITEANDLVCWPEKGRYSEDQPDGKFDSVSVDDPSCALRDGVPHCWGHIAGYTKPPRKVAFKTISIDYRHGCGITQDDHIVCWAAEGTKDDRGYSPEGKFRFLATGATSNCAIDFENTLTCWGWNNLGQAPSDAWIVED